LIDSETIRSLNEDESALFFYLVNRVHIPTVEIDESRAKSLKIDLIKELFRWADVNIKEEKRELLQSTKDKFKHLLN